MKKIFPFIILVVVLAVFFQSFLLKGLLPIPSDTIIGLYHPFRDFYAKDYPRGIPYKNFLITDPVRQQIPWRNLVISLEKAGQLPLWNPYSFSGSPLLGNFQSAPFYPLNILFFIFPFQIAWSLLVFLQPLLGWLFLYLYLRSLKLRPEAALLGSLALVFSGFFVSWLEWNTILHVVLWLPLLLLAIDKLLKQWTWQWGIVFIVAEIASFLGGHLQMLFYCLCISSLYLVVRILQKAKKQEDNNVSFARLYFPFVLSGIAIVAITAIVWVPSLQFIFLSGRSVDQVSITQSGWFIPWQHLIQFILPDFFGNPTTLNYWGVWNYAELVGYVGIVPLLFALYAILFRHDKKTYFFGLLALSSLLFALPTPFGKLPFELHIPLLSTSQPTRLLFVTDFSLAILCALGFDYFLAKRQKRIGIVLGALGGIFALTWIVVFHFGSVLMISAENLHTAKQNLVFPTALLVLSSLTILFLILYKNKKRTISWMLIGILLIITSFDLLRFAWKFTPFTPTKYLFPKTKTIQFLQSHLGNFRYMTTSDQILPPNFSTYYRLQSIDGYDPLYVLRYGEFIAALQRGKPNIMPPFGYNRIITPHTYESPLINLLGVKYVLSLTDLNSKNLIKVFQEGETRVYQNMSVFPRAFFVQQIIPSYSKQEAIQDLFSTSFIATTTAVVESNAHEILAYARMTREDARLINQQVTITSYQPNRVSIETENDKEGFLILTDVYYPTWHVAIDGKESSIVETDYTFRGVQVPPGKHHLVFYDRLF